MTAITHENGVYYAQDVSTADGARLLELGWVRHAHDLRVWWTRSPYLCAPLWRHCDTIAMAAVRPWTWNYETSFATGPLEGTGVDGLRLPVGASPFPFQVAGVQRGLMRKRILIADPMGCGKTVQACGILNSVRPRRTVIGCPTFLTRNWAAELERWCVDPQPIVILDGAKKSLPDEGLIILPYSRGHAFVDQILAGPPVDLVILDECFPAGTLVQTERGPLDIANVVDSEIDVRVVSQGERGIELMKITRFIRTTTETLVTIRHQRGELKCSPNHMIYVERGDESTRGQVWKVRADKIRGGDTLCFLRETVRTVAGDDNSILQSPLCFGREAEAEIDNGMPEMRSTAGGSSNDAQVLLDGMCNGLSHKATASVNVRMVQEGFRAQKQGSLLRPALLRLVENEESSVRGHCNGGVESEPTTQGTQESCGVGLDARVERKAGLSRQTGRECFVTERKILDRPERWERPVNMSPNSDMRCDWGFSQSHGIGNIGCACEAGLRKPSAGLQSGHRYSAFAPSDRDRRKLAFDEKMEISGQTENRSFERTRVVSVEIHEQAGKGRTTVYNIEVERNHNYVANGILVGNCHFLKENSARRTQAWLGDKGLARRADRVVALSGTPMPNNPLELYGLLSVLAPDLLKGVSRDRFKELYCSSIELPMNRRNAVGEKIKVEKVSAKSTAVLNAELRASGVMVRRDKSEVLTQLPAKNIFFVHMNPSSEIESLVREEADLYEQLQMKLLSNKELMEVRGHVATVRQRLGVLKAPMIAEYVNTIMESGEDRCVVFMLHLAAIEIVREALAKHGLEVLVLTGAESPRVRQDRVDRFQAAGGRRVILGQTTAAGVGLTMTAARFGVLGEISWVPAWNEQAIDRLHRITQTRSVQCAVITFPHAIEEKVVRTNARKSLDARAVLDVNLQNLLDVPAETALNVPAE